MRSRRVNELDRTEIYERERIAAEFFAHLNERHGITNDTLINNSFGKACLKQSVVGLPVFARISNRTLVLANYALTHGVCQALGTYLHQSVRRLNQSFVLKRIVLDQNNLSDADFAALLSGLKH